MTAPGAISTFPGFFPVQAATEAASPRLANGTCNHRPHHWCNHAATLEWRIIMGRGILLWLLGVPIPIIIILALVWR